jgi:hypothetical protein
MRTNVFFKACIIFTALAVPPIFAGEVTLEDDSLRVAFDTDSGALTRLENKTTHWVIERRPELGVSFRLFAPLPNRRWNPVFGQKQHAAEVTKVSANEVHLQWKNLVSENGGVLPMTLTSLVTLTNGVLTFKATLENDSTLTVETLDYPYLGDFNAPSRDSSLEVRVMTNNQPNHLKMDQIYPHFGNEKGYWGDFWPLKTREAQVSPFCLISAPDEGLYAEVAASPGQKSIVPYRLQWTFEQHPGVLSGVTQLVPAEDKIAGTPVHLEFRACHFIFAGPHSTVDLAPIALRGYPGDWHAGVAIYQQ